MTWLLIRLLGSVALAYPVAGVFRALFLVLWPVSNPTPLLAKLWMFLVLALVEAIATIATGGYPGQGPGVPSFNMYPYIGPTAVVIFLLWIRIWRWKALAGAIRAKTKDL